MIDPAQHDDIRAEVAKLCARFPGEYWRALDERMAYPTEFVHELTKSGYLAADSGGIWRCRDAIVGGRSDPRGNPAGGCNGGACHAQMYVMGTVLRHGSAAQKKRYLPQIADW